ncbi:hypothetical protein [Bradyrhizobium elkanii]|uniref:hypothetical protein n=1 Tax=Bradyrhizobium elkanii TaxID=29448 RepID=UPI002714D4DE|nr:hypothetical protein [Bradyrhizobium elkanii]WLB05146.1 hypothetical protein QNJ80_45150 [Bradyrhizobium elkanii]
MLRQQANVTQLVALRESSTAKALSEKDIDNATTQFIEDLKKANIDTQQLESGGFKIALRKALADKYAELLKPQKTDEQKKKEAADEAQKKEDEKRDKKVAEACEDADNGLNNAVDAAYAAIFAYCRKFRQKVGGDATNASPFEKQLDEFRREGGAIAAARAAIPNETGTVTFTSSDLLNITLPDMPAVLRTPLGDFPRIGVRRSGVMEFEDQSTNDLSPSAPGRNSPAFLTAISGSVFVALYRQGTPHPQIARRVGAWLQQDGTSVSRSQAQKLAGNAPWTIAAALSRTARLLLDAWRGRLHEIREALRIPLDVL